MTYVVHVMVLRDIGITLVIVMEDLNIFHQVCVIKIVYKLKKNIMIIVDIVVDLLLLIAQHHLTI